MMNLRLSKCGAESKELAKGTEVEMEHFQDDRLRDAIEDGESDEEAAAQVAKVHLEESPKYYEFLDEMEKTMKKDTGDNKNARNLFLGGKMAGVSMENVKINNMKFCLWSIVKELDKVPVVGEEADVLGIGTKQDVKEVVTQNIDKFFALYNQVFGETN
jgi:hypothetical protein